MNIQWGKSTIALPVEVAQQVHIFSSDIATYRAQSFKEAKVRSDFINIVFSHLGWNMDNNGLLFNQREVEQEDSLDIEGKKKSPDYAFLANGRRKFYVEAKAPHVPVLTNTESAYQIRNYSWNNSLPFGILTDFEEWAIYDCRKPPAHGDAASVGRIAYFTYEQLEENWEPLLKIFGQDAVANGSIEEYAQQNAKPTGAKTVDRAFLEEIRAWRLVLATEIFKNHPTAELESLKTTVQSFIDRIVFLRIAEDRGLEQYGSLESVLAPGSTQEMLNELFRKADSRYNSGIFHPFELMCTDGGVSDSDIFISYGTISEIVKHLYFPYPYNFRVIPPDILGQIYEQFLGEELEVVEGRVIVSKKPEVKKATGVYYTPGSIVNYIVEETLGLLLNGASATRASQISIVDPSCGSGSFLVRAYQYLIDWHTSKYMSNTADRKKFLETLPNGDLRLSTKERRRILQKQIFGVDIDPQACEVTKLSLLLIMIEGQEQTELHLGHLLPDLTSSIRCGNSLISPDEAFGEIWNGPELQLRPFDWRQSFPDVFKSGGFDVVIGNPPYFSVDATWGVGDYRARYLKRRYGEIFTDKTDILYYFLGLATEIGKAESAFIVSRAFLEADKAQKLREYLSLQCRVRQVVDFRDAVVFPGVGISTAIIHLTKSNREAPASFAIFKQKVLRPGYDSSYLKNNEDFKRFDVDRGELNSTRWSFGDTVNQEAIRRIDRSGVRIGDVFRIGKGMETGANKAFTFAPSDEQLVELRALGLIKKRVRNSDIDAFSIRDVAENLLFIEDVQEFESLPPYIQEHLFSARPALESRAAFKRGDSLWWKYSWPLHQDCISVGRIFVPYRAASHRFALDYEAQYVGLTDTNVIYDTNGEVSLKYLVGLLNSRPLEFRFRFLAKQTGGGLQEFFANSLAELQLPAIDKSDERVSVVEALVDELAGLKRLRKSLLVPGETSENEELVRMAKASLDAVALDLYELRSNDLTD